MHSNSNPAFYSFWGIEIRDLPATQFPSKFLHVSRVLCWGISVVLVIVFNGSGKTKWLIYNTPCFTDISMRFFERAFIVLFLHFYNFWTWATTCILHFKVVMFLVVVYLLIFRCMLCCSLFRFYVKDVFLGCKEASMFVWVPSES